MRINLDYYRILSVPIKASSSQLERAYGDRIKQQPRRDYSKAAIAMRKKLLNRAFKVLSNPEQRAEYDSKFLEPSTPQPINSQDTSDQVIDPKSQTFEKEKTLSSPPEADLSDVKLSDVLDLEAENPPTASPLSAEPYLEIEEPLIIGALIILHELAEYEMVISIGNDYLRQANNSSSSTAKQSVDKGSLLLSNGAINSTTNSGTNLLGESTQNSRSALKQQEIHTDAIFCISLSCLEISREKWRRQEWEEAASYGEQSLKILQQESSSLFPHLQTEIQSELNLLKPYRILNLLEHNIGTSKLRSRGLKLLEEVLAQREGIENTNIDPSGLKSDQFLYFIQQIRNYLTLSEQKELFLVESKRGSHPGSCIAAYALIAEGFARKKPSSVMQANDILINLGQHQNTHWERAICALLLGQAEESQEVIEQIRQDSTYALIKKRSHDSPDLLPGLCFYGEQWLNKEVLSQFQDLKSSKITLSEYFNDSNVQAYLDTVAPIAYKKRAPDSFEVKNNLQKTTQEDSSIDSNQKARPQVLTQKQGILSFLPWLGNEQKSSQNIDNRDLQQQDKSHQNKRNRIDQAPAGQAKVAQKYPPQTPVKKQVSSYAKGKQKTSDKNAAGFYKSTPIANGSYQNVTLPNPKDKASSDLAQGSFTKNGKGSNTAVKDRHSDNHGNGSGGDQYDAGKPKNSKQRRKFQSSSSNQFLKNSLFLLALVAGLGTLSFLFTRTQLSSNDKSSKDKIVKKSVGESKSTQPNSTQPNSPQLNVGKPKTDSPAAKVPGTENAKPTPKTPDKASELASKKLDQSGANLVIQKWLDGKKAALGKDYAATQLSQVLTGEMLTQWQERSNYYKQNKVHRQLQHNLSVKTVKIDPSNPNIATVEAEVTEDAQHYQGEKLNQSQSYNDNLLVRYKLIKQDDSWLINNSEVVK